MRFILLLFNILCCYCLLSQNNITGFVADQNGSLIPFATIQTMKGEGVACNIEGYFKLPYQQDQLPTIVISAVGYRTDTLSALANDQTYQLQTTDYTLASVHIVAHQDIAYKSSLSAFTVDKKEINNTQARHLTEVLQNKVGFTSKSGYQAALTLRGMSGRRLLVLRNGTRRFSSYPAGFMSHTMNIYDLERIEIEKGASSVIYGAGAMAGIINLIDKSPFKQDGLNMKLTTGYGTINNEKNGLLCGGWSNGKFALKSGYRYRTADNFSYPDGTVAENSFYTDQDLFVTTGYQFSDKQSLVFTTDIHRGGPWGKPVGFNGSDYMRVQTLHENTNNYSLKYKLYHDGLMESTEANAYFSNESRELVKNYYTAAGYHLSYRETTNFSDYYYGASYQSTFRFSPKYAAIVGVESYLFNISTPIDAIDYIVDIAFSNRISHDARSQNSGAYIENQYKFNSKCSAILGVRYNVASIDEGDAYADEDYTPQNQSKNAFNGNLALKYMLGDKSTLKLNVARSFRMPETTELFTDNYGSNGIVYANPALLPEYCNSTDISYRYSGEYLFFEFSPFLWLMDDMITKEIFTGLPGTNYTYINVGKTRLFGGEVDVRLQFNGLLKPKDKLKIEMGVAYLNGTNITEEDNYWSEGTPLNYMPPFNMKGNAMYEMPISKHVKMNFILRTIYYAEQTRLGDDPYATPAYWLFGCNAGLSWTKHKVNPALSVAVNNLLNAEYFTYQSYLPSEGRDVRVFLTLKF